MYEFIMFLAVLFWIYLGHYAVILVLSKNKKFEFIENSKYRPKITVIIPINKKTNLLSKKIRNTINLNYPKRKMQIIVVDSKAGYNKLICSKFRKISYIKRTKENLNNALNLGFKLAKGEIIVKTDHDCFLPKNALLNLIKYFNDKKIGVVAGTEKVTRYPMKFYRDIVNDIRIKESLIGSTWTGGSFYAFRKKIIHSLPETKLITDDTFLSFESIKKGYRVVSVKDVRVKENIPKNILVTIKKFRRYFTQGIYTTLYQKDALLVDPFFTFVTLKNFMHLMLAPLLIYILIFLNYNLFLFTTPVLLLLAIFSKFIRNIILIFSIFLLIWPIAVLFAIFKIEKW